MNAQSGYQYSHTLGFCTINGQGFWHPVDFAMGRDGVLYVLNRGTMELRDFMSYKRITVCTLDDRYLGQFSGGGSGDGQIMWPSAIALDRDENLYFSDEGLQRITIVDKEGRFLAKWGIKGNGDGEFDRPASIVFDKDENLLVVDGLNNRIQRYTKEGRFLGQWGRAGAGDGEFNMPWGIALDHANNVYVTDWRNDRIQKFDADGSHLNTWGESGDGDGQFHRPSGLAVDAEGTIFVADWGNERVQVLGPDGAYRAQFKGESGLSKWAQDWFASDHMDLLEEREKSNMEPPLDPPVGEFFRNEPAGIEKLFWAPTTVKLDEQGNIYIVDTCRHRIQVYRQAQVPTPV